MSYYGELMMIILMINYLLIMDFSNVDVETSFLVGRDVTLILKRSEM